MYQEHDGNAVPVTGRMFITLCPGFTDRFTLPAKGFENKDLTFEKYTLLMERNFLLKNYSYKGQGQANSIDYPGLRIIVAGLGTPNGNSTVTTFCRLKFLDSNAIRMPPAMTS